MDSQALRSIARLVATTPRRMNQVVFLGRKDGQFIDNVKYAFLHCAAHVPELRCVFIGGHRNTCLALRRANLPAAHLGAQEAVDHLLQAGVVVCDDFWWRHDPLLTMLVSPAKVVQLWHGIPLKAIGFPEIESPVNMTPEKATYLTEMYSGYDSVLSTSPFFTEHAFARAFKAEAFPELGYPRNDVLLRSPQGLDMLNVDAALYARMMKIRKQGGKTVLFMPTFRDTGGGPLEEEMIDFARLHSFNEKHNILFICKLHPYVAARLQGRLPTTIHMAESSSDVYPLLRITDLLLTDYSSVYFDFLLTNRPILFYPYDLERYVTTSRSLLFDYHEMTPGFHATTQDELFTYLEALLVRAEDPHQPQREALAVKSFTHQDANAAARLGQYILERFVNT
jgi:CDP-glycerol glycerophosphotransferase (TagB/SpsB family)